VDLVHLFSIMNPDLISMEFLIAGADGFTQFKHPHVKQLVTDKLTSQRLCLIYRGFDQVGSEEQAAHAPSTCAVCCQKQNDGEKLDAVIDAFALGALAALGIFDRRTVRTGVVIDPGLWKCSSQTLNSGTLFKKSHSLSLATTQALISI